MAPIRTHTADNVDIVTFGGAVRHRWNPRNPDQSLSMTIHLDPKFNAHLPHFKNPANPAYHWHYHQREDFRIEKGSVIFHVDGKDVVKTKADGLITIHPGTYHSFRADPDSPEEVVLHVTTPRDDHGVTERFFRNVYSYNEDCIEQKVSPNICQIFLFVYSTDTYLAFPGPKFIGQPLSRYLTWFLGVVVGKNILGFKESYDEYYNPAVAQN
jgi:quercetin dioxygenase-like cupin family protein